MSIAEGPAAGGGLLGSVRALARTLLALSKTRLEIFLNEIEEERLRIARQIVLVVLAGFCLTVGALLAVTFVVVLFWDTHRLLSLGLLAIAFLGGGAGLVMLFAARARAKPKLFSDSLGELTRDLEQLSDKP
jgi:uncharacterized membrane protein YqjE